MKLGEVTTILRALAAVEAAVAADAAVEGRINFSQMSKQSTEDATNL